jgi:hypothetical protein
MINKICLSGIRIWLFIHQECSPIGFQLFMGLCTINPFNAIYWLTENVYIIYIFLYDIYNNEEEKWP